MTAADQPTTEPSASWADEPTTWIEEDHFPDKVKVCEGTRASSSAIRIPRVAVPLLIEQLTAVAPAPQPAADTETEGVRHFAPWGTCRASCGAAVPPGEAPESSGFTYRRNDTTCPDCRSHFTNPADADTEPTDEHIDTLRTDLAVARDRLADALNARHAAVVARVARLDAVVTAVRDLHKPVDEPGRLECGACPSYYPCPTVRALDGGAA